MEPSLEEYARWVLHPPLPEHPTRLVADPVGMTREVLGFLDIDTDGVAITPLTLPTSV